MDRKTEGKMPTTTRFDLGGEGMPNFSGAGKKILQLAIVVLAAILLMASTTSIPTGHVGVLTLFGRVTGQTLPEGIHLVNPLKSVQKMSEIGHLIDGQYDFDSNRTRGSADALRARDRTNIARRDPPGQSVEIGAKNVRDRPSY